MQKKEGLLSLGYLSLALALTFVGSFGIGSVPPFLAAISPSEGIWRRKIQGEKYQRIPSPFLRKSAQAYYDKSGVVHVFAQTDHDLYWIQGFITARDRLWQMDFQSRVADGRLAELLGKKALGLDEYFVSVGMRQAISLADENLQTDPTTQMPVSAFVSGVNSYVESLEERDYPLEYILTGTKPKKWSSRDIASLLKLMSFRLAGHSDDLVMTRYLQKFGDKILQDLFPYQHDLEVPFARVGGGRQSDPSARVLSEPFIARLQGFPSFLKPRPGNGSNNWALSGKKTKLGFSLLANDTHLSYSLPSIWYEMQLNSPHQSVYGATIPGAPGIILGYNNQIAWATTNASTDVMDW
ncbi:MAG: penicillin acylase family protein, partial [Bdellovibrionales bacterium]|nr:penicillin acylase family protein [Bdellovibrionales bacterium]